MVFTPTKSSLNQRETEPDIVWEKLPADFILPDDLVDHIDQPAIAAALTESLSLAGYLAEPAITTTNYSICVKYQGRMVVKAPDWSWVPAISVPRAEIKRSYTPVLEGELPWVVMEFVSATEGSEYSIKSSYPPGKLFFYEQILKVKNYIIFSLETGAIEYYRLSDEGRYALQPPNDQGRYWLPEANVFLGIWEGQRQDLTGRWLRWWDEDDQLLLWGSELTVQAREWAEQERERAEVERVRAEEAEQVQYNAIAKLTEMCLSVDQIADTLGLATDVIEQQLAQQQPESITEPVGITEQSTDQSETQPTEGSQSEEPQSEDPQSEESQAEVRAAEESSQEQSEHASEPQLIEA